MPTFRPVHPQPFTFDHACQLDPPTISAGEFTPTAQCGETKLQAEISRLQHSLQVLESTQRQLQEAISEGATPDPELKQALGENSAVIASQQERIMMLRAALEAQGAAIADNPHYDLQPRSVHPTPSGGSPRMHVQSSEAYDDSEGVYL